MRVFPTTMFLRYMRALALLEKSEGRILLEEIGPTVRNQLTGFVAQAEDYQLLSVADQWKRIGAGLAGNTIADINPFLTELMNRLEDDCARHIMMMIDPAHAKYITNPQFFDSADPNVKKASAQFPSAAEDIAEAGLCFACGRGTACVMHLARVLEFGLQALAKALGVGSQNNWGKYLSEIDAELQKRIKASGTRTPDEQFYSEVHITFDAVRRAWRNPTMHVEKTYTVERAEEIMTSVRSFMRHLASRLSD